MASLLPFYANITQRQNKHSWFNNFSSFIGELFKEVPLVTRRKLCDEMISNFGQASSSVTNFVEDEEDPIVYDLYLEPIFRLLVPNFNQIYPQLRLVYINLEQPEE